MLRNRILVFHPVYNPRQLRHGRETFCLALVKHALSTSGACRASICLTSSVCRFEFLPGSLDTVELAQRAASAIRAATRDASGPNVPDRKQPWVSITGFAAGATVSIWEALMEEPGRVFLSHPALCEAPWLAVRVARMLRGLPGVKARRANFWFGQVEIEIDSVSSTVADLVTVAEEAFSRESAAVDAANAPPGEPADFEERTPAGALPRRRLVDLLLAGGTFAVAVAGVIVPGVPTAPFLLLAHHYLHRGAPETLGRLCHLPGVGWMIRKADRADRAERSWKDRKALLKSLAWSALSAAVFLVVHPPLPVALAIEFGLAAFSGLNA